MEQERYSILCLCSQLKQEEGHRPLSTAEFRDLSILLESHGKTPGDLFRLSPRDLLSIGMPESKVTRIFTLLDRFPVVETMVGSYKSLGIRILTPADARYFPTLKATLGLYSPPVLCCAGDLSLGEKAAVGIVGARDISPADGLCAKEIVGKLVSKGYGIVSGGARGTDSIAETEAITQGGCVVEFPAVPLLRKIRDPQFSSLLEKKQLLLATPVAPHVGFSNSLAVIRNRMIYAHSLATVVIRATECRGGTWTGATDALKRNLCPVLCWDQPYSGNQGLIRAGAIPFDSQWNGTLPNGGVKNTPPAHQKEEMPEQFSIF